MTRRSLSWLLSASALLSAAACVDDDVIAEPIDDQWELFKSSAVKIADEPVRYLYGGDMLAVGEDGLRRAYERYFAPSGVQRAREGTTSSQLTVDRILGFDQLLRTTYSDSSGGRYQITYCVQRNTFSATELAALDAALPLATDSWNGLVNVAFRHEPSQDASCGVSNTGVFFNVRGVSSGQFFASAFFPEDGRGARELLIDDSAFTTTANGRDLQGILRHETGHILGFRHEHVWLGNCTSEGIDSARHVTAYDEGSVMHYPQCRDPAGGGYRQSKLDYQGAIELYGLVSFQIMALL